jgi:flagellar capping protein FliD
MDLASIVKTQVQLAQLGQSTQSSSSSAATQLLAPANKRLTQQLESTNVQLSAYGQISSDFGSAKTAASGLSNTVTSKTATNSDVVKAAQAFVDSYNQATQAVGSAVNGTGTKAGALASDIRVKLAGNDLAHSLTSGAGGVSDFLCVRREETFPRCGLPKVPLDRRRAARWESRWSF